MTNSSEKQASLQPPLWNTDRSIGESFLEGAKTNADLPAIRSEGWSGNYRQLATAVTSLAHQLALSGVACGDRVVLLMNHDGPQSIAALAILLAGGVVVATNPSDPTVRIESIVQNAEPVLILSDSSNAATASILATESVQWKLLQTDGILQETNCECSPVPSNLPVVQPQQLAFLIFTSGTTGKPKGVMQTHCNILANIRRQGVGLGICKHDRILMTASLSGGQGLATWAMALLSNATLIPFSVMEYGLSGMGRTIQEHQITMIAISSSLFRQFMAITEPEERFDSVRWVRLASEKTNATDLRSFAQHFPDSCKVFHTYSSSETGNMTQAVYSKSEYPSKAIHVGREAEDIHLETIKLNGYATEPHSEGEIVVISPFLSPGYWKQEALTKQRFFTTPQGQRAWKTGDIGFQDAHGHWFITGRRDHQIKIHGNQINLEAVAETLQTIEGVREAVVIPDTLKEHPSLTAFIVPQAGCQLSPSHLRIAWQAVLPMHMVPASVRFINTIPTNANGKVDFEGLRNLVTQTKTPEISRTCTCATSTESFLASIWSKEIGASKVGRDSDFFALGGDSLNAVVIVALVEKHFGIRLTLKSLFQHPQLKHFADLVDSFEKPKPTLRLKRGPRNRSFPMTWSQRSVWSAQNHLGRNAWVTITVYQITGNLDVPRLKHCLKLLVQRHEILRTTFEETKGEYLQNIHPPDPDCDPIEEIQEVFSSHRAFFDWLQIESEKPFDLSKGPMFRFQVARTANQSVFLSRISNHIISDAWSWNLLMGELAILYESQNLEFQTTYDDEARPQLADYAVWEEQQLKTNPCEIDLLIQKWISLFDPKVPQTEPPVPPPANPESVTPADGRIQFGIPKSISKKLHLLAQRKSVSFYALRLAAFCSLLGLREKQQVVLGTYNSNRHILETQSIFGFLANNQVIPLDYDPLQPFTQLLSHVQDRLLLAQEIAFIPYGYFCERVETMGKQVPKPLVYFSAIDFTEQMSFAGLNLKWCERLHLGMPWGFSFRVNRSQEEKKSWVFFDARIADPNSVKAFVLSYQKLLARIATKPHLPINTILKRIPDYPKRSVVLGAKTSSFFSRLSDLIRRP